MSTFDSQRFKEILRRERLARMLTQAQLAEQIGADYNTVSRWERGKGFPTPYLRQKLCEFFNMAPGELGLVDKEPSLIRNIPFRRNSLFAGRENILARLHSQLDKDKSLLQAVALSGLGGIGKTQTAVEYAYRHQDEYHTILWVSASTAEILRSDYVKLASLLHLPEKEAQDQNITIAAVKHWLTQQRDWLLILDNVDDIVMVRDFLPEGGNTNGRILLTTRAPSVGTIAHCITIEQMNQEEGTWFLLRRAGVLPMDAPLGQVTRADQAQAEAIVAVVDGLPLALDQAGGYIDETKCGLAEYLRLYQTQHKELLRRRSLFSGDYSETVATTWSLSFYKIGWLNPAAADLLRVCAFLDPDAIPEEIITEGAPDLGGVLGPVAVDPFKLNEALEAIQRYSLVRRHPETKTLSIHRVVQTVLRDEMGPEKQQEWAERTVKAVNRAFPDIEFSKWHNCQRCLPHVQTSITLIEQWNKVFPEAARLLNQAGRYLTERAQFDQAERFLMQAQALYRRLQNAEHLDMATTLNNVAWLHYKLGRYTQAELLYMQAKMLCEQALGTEDPAVAQILNDLALVYYNQGRYTQAEPLYQQALEIREKTLGTEHPDVATTLNKMAWLYYNQGKYTQAEPLYQRALEIWKQMRGLEYPDAATSRNGLAMLYRALGKYNEAEQLYLQALEIREKTLGAEHPDVATTRNDMAWFYRTQGKYAHAEHIYQWVLVIRKQVLGPEHLHVATTLNDLAVLYVDQGKYEQAEPLLLQVLAVRERTLGPEHPRVATSCNNIGWLYFNLGQYAKAESYHLRALAVRKQVLGSKHPHVGRSYNALGEVYHAQGKYDQAEEYYRQALEISQQTTGIKHALRATYLNNLASLYADRGKYTQAEDLYGQALRIREKSLGPEHPRVAQSLNGLAGLSVVQSRYEQAEPLYQRALAIREKVLGPEHPDVAQSRSDLGSLYFYQGRYHLAEPLFSRALAIKEKALGIAHPSTHDTICKLACLYQKKGQYERAELFFQRVRSTRQKDCDCSTDNHA